MRTCASHAQELLSELKDANLFGKRGEALLFAQVAVIMLFLFPPFALKVRCI